MRPRHRPGRTALGAATLAFYVVLFVGGGQDIIAQQTDIDVGTIRTMLRIGLFVVPPLVAMIVWKVCRDLAAEADSTACNGASARDPASQTPTPRSPPA